MTKDTALQIGEEDDKGAFVITNTDRLPKVEHALKLIYDGKSTKVAAKEAGLTTDEFKGALGRNTEYSLIHARAKLVKYCNMIEDLMEYVETIPNRVDKGETFKLEKKYDAMKFCIAQYSQHVEQAVKDSALSITVNSSNSQPLVIQLVNGSDESKPLTVNALDAIDVVESESQ